MSDRRRTARRCCVHRSGSRAGRGPKMSSTLLFAMRLSPVLLKAPPPEAALCTPYPPFRSRTDRDRLTFAAPDIASPALPFVFMTDESTLAWRVGPVDDN